jgi:hypothetical protein
MHAASLRRYEDIKEIGVAEVGSRRKVYRAITAWRDDRDIKKAEAIRSRMAHMEALTTPPPPPPPADETMQRISQLRHTLSGLPPT